MIGERMNEFMKILMATIGLMALSGIGYWIVRKD